MTTDRSQTKKRKTSTLAANRDILNADENAMIDKLVECGQDHLFTNWPAPGTDDDDKSSLVSDTASSVLVDMSLAGCCGVQSTCGGLVITASFHPKGAPSAPDRSKTRSKSLSKARLPPVPAPAGASQV